jgi:Uma2 family endonuclease
MSARSAVQRAFHSVRDYTRMERESPVKHEYFDGQMYAMAGGTAAHALLAGVIYNRLAVALDGGRCRVYPSDLRVRIRKTGLFTYPDVTVICGKREPDPEDPDCSAINPTVLVEVTSKSTEKYDRGDKFEQYKQIPSLREYVLVSQRERAIEVWRRTRGGWTRHVSRPGEQAMLRSLDVDVPLDVDAIYRAGTESTASGRGRKSRRKGTGRRRSR